MLRYMKCAVRVNRLPLLQAFPEAIPTFAFLGRSSKA